MELPRIYPEEHYEKKAKRYSRALRYIFGVRVDQTTENRWSSLIGLARGIDTYLDTGDRNDLSKRTADIEQLLHEPDEVASQFPPLAPEQLGQDRFNTVQRLGVAIVRTSLKYHCTPEISKYARLRRIEGGLYADLISSVATPETADQPGYDRFARWLQPIGEVTNLVNSLNDIHQDYERGELALEPDRLTRLRIFGHTAVAIKDALHVAKSPAS